MAQRGLSYRFDGARYHIDGHGGEASFGDLLKWQFNGQRARWPRWVENRHYPPPPERVTGSDMCLTWIGHSAVLVQAAGLNILTDPFLSPRASPTPWAGPKRVRPPGLAAEDMPPLDLVLVSHNHYDHLDLPALTEISRHHKPRVVTPKGNARLIAKANRSLRIDELDWHEGVGAGAARITVTPAFHWSKRTAFDTNQALWGAFVVETDAGEIVVAQARENAVIGEIAILCDVPRTATVRANDELVVLKIKKEHFLGLMTDFPKLAIQVMRELALRLSRTTSELTEARRKLETGKAG